MTSGLSAVTTLPQRARRVLGCLANDVPLYLWAFARGHGAYLAIRNRAERLEVAPDGAGYRCDWQWTSELHGARVFPVLGRQLMRRALSDHPIECRDAPLGDAGDVPELSFLIGHRGTERLPHLLATLGSIAAQRDASIECIVVEQEARSQLGTHLPSWVRLVHTPPPSPEMPYSRSWSFNVGARHARGAVLVLHDNDMLVPVDYAARILHRVRQGYEVVNLKRFIFYLSRTHSQAIFAGAADLLNASPEVVVQNLEGGGSIAITAAAFERIGGMDESFVGWGGEDNEFWERAQAVRVWPWADLPLAHLWHAAQPGKQSRCNGTARRYEALSRIAPSERIARLRRASAVRFDSAAPRASDRQAG